jgi:hypothetical protein
VYPWLNGFGLAGGVGIFHAPSARGVSSTSAGITAGAEYEFSSSAWMPVLGIRFTRFAGSAGGIRWLMSPAAGLRF